MDNNETRNQEKYVIYEGMTSISALINALIVKNSDRQIYKIYYDKSKENSKSGQLEFLRRNSALIGYEIIPVTADDITHFTSGTTHGGIIALCGDRSYQQLSEECLTPNGFYVYLEGIEDPYNFGDSLRSIYAAGADGIIISPRNWLGGAAGVVARSSAGASELLPVFVATSEEAAKIFASLDYLIVTAGIRNSISLFDADIKRPLLLVIGGEKRGISRAFLDKSTMTVRIDYGRNFKGSLSTSASAAVMAFEVMKKIGKAGRE